MSHAFELPFTTCRARAAGSRSECPGRNPGGGQASLWFGFVDDIVIRASPDDIRSHSCQRRVDLGVNAACIEKYIAALQGVPSPSS
jgi:hypothetical protein